MSLYNIIFSTTRQWNPGDEFILFGVMNILDAVGVNYNPIIYNRNPEIRFCRNIRHGTTEPREKKGIQFIPKNMLRALKGNIDSLILRRFISESPTYKEFYELDNSFKMSYFEHEKKADYVIFAGSPEWNTHNTWELYKYISSFDIKTLFFGVGNAGTYSGVPQYVKDVIKKSEAITVRDESPVNFLTQNGNKFERFPCPALLSSKSEKKVTEVKKIGLMYTHHESVYCNRVSPETYDYTIALYKRLMEKFSSRYEFKVICHYIDEIMYYDNCLNTPAYYSFDARDYFGIYSDCDFVIGPRVHGVGIASSMGIPGVAIKHDNRGETPKGFKAEIITVGENIDESAKKIEGLFERVEELSSKIISHKKETKKRYISLLNGIF